jgi:nitrite reductase/ring-hydroxylating ferredoxin subunit
MTCEVLNGRLSRDRMRYSGDRAVVTMCRMSGKWWVISNSSFPREGERIHVNLEGRFITIFRHHGVLSSIDSICHHAGGPLTLGNIIDIEELGMSVVSCPW